MFYGLENFKIWPHHSDYLLVGHECGWSEETNDGISMQEIWEIMDKHWNECAY